MKDCKILSLRNFLLIFAVTFSYSVSAQSTTTNFVIHGSFKDMSNVPAKVYLIYASFLNHPTDSAVVADGKYQFEGYTEQPTGAQLSITPKIDSKILNSTNQIILDKGELDVQSVDTFAKVEVSGSGALSHNAYTDILKKNKMELVELSKSMATDQFKNDPEFKKTTLNRFYFLISSSLNDLMVFVRKTPQSPVSPFIAYTLVSSGLVTHAMSDTLAQTLPAAKAETKMGKQIFDIIAKQKEFDQKQAAANTVQDDKILVGSKAIDFVQYDAAGKSVSLSSYKGKYVLVDFWASWCGPCRAENPNVVKAYNKYKDKGFTVLGVSLDGQSTKTAWLAAIKKDGLTWREVSDLSGWNNAAAKLYGVHAIPMNFLIDPNGNIIGKNLRGDDLNNKLASLFKN